MEILTVSNLKKCFGEKEVLRGVELSVPEHSIFGFAGRNGAGKTTTMKAILGLLKPDAGSMTVAGQPVAFGQTATNRHIGYLPDIPEFYPFMTPMEYLKLCGEACGMKASDIPSRSAELLKTVGLGAETHRIKGFSRGMKQRLGIAQALLNRPRLLICDEPTSALDPAGRKEILDILLAAREQTTVFFSTHILPDAERICTDIAFLNQGKIVLQGKVADLRALHSSKNFTLELQNAQDVNRLLQSFPGLRPAPADPLLLTGSEEMLFPVLHRIAENQIAVQRVERAEPSLEALFLEVTGK